jgi:hypothetical protein
MFLNIQFFWDVMICHWVCSSPDIAKFIGCANLGQAAQKHSFYRQTGCIIQALAGGGKRRSTGGKPTE